MIFTTAAVAVVLHPFASSITDTRRGPKNACFASCSIASPLRTSVPPMNTAEFFKSAGPRVNIAPYTRSRTSRGSMPPYCRIASTPAS